MKEIVIIRHAKSTWKTKDIADIDRPLSERGMLDAHRVGRYIKQKEITLDRWHVSTANRAMHTALIMQRMTHFPVQEIVMEPHLYTFNTDVVMNYLCRLPEDQHRVALFGHNPALETLIERLCGHFVGALPTCGMAHMEFEVAQWKDLSSHTGRIMNYVVPKDLR